MAVLAVPARQTVQTVWTVLARQTGQDRKDPAVRSRLACWIGN
jgi:hypothetical protein